ncbi:MAG TPA: hypothetical protein VE825_09425 [Terriglobales bacterium]|nr:hypothetical protein [Terriglobales bacterium]
MFYSALQMPDFSSTLRVGDHAHDFTLLAANRPGSFSLGDLLRAGSVMVES